METVTGFEHYHSSQNQYPHRVFILERFRAVQLQFSGGLQISFITITASCSFNISTVTGDNSPQ